MCPISKIAKSGKSLHPTAPGYVGAPVLVVLAAAVSGQVHQGAPRR